MEPTQNSTEISEITEAVDHEIAANAPLTLQQQTWVDFNAVGGLITEEDGSIRLSNTRKSKDGVAKKYNVEDLAYDLGVSRDTLYYWSRNIADFQERVDRRRKELYSSTRVTQVWNGLYLKARSGNARAADIFLRNFDDNYISPTKTVQHEAGNSWAKLLAKKRDRKIIETQEAEIIRDTPSGSTTPN
jgi:hypothetical protein